MLFCIMKFAVVDVETTGGSPARGSLTEIGIVIVENGKIIETYNQLINPGMPVPVYITALTGITDEMLADQPKFEEVADEIYDLLNGKIFCAHNVKFDYAFVRAAFSTAGITFNATRKVCTVKYTRRVVKGLKSYALGNLCKRFGIVNENPHRALGDALAAAEVLNFVRNLDRTNTLTELLKHKSSEFSLPQKIESKTVNSLPEEPGIYRFLNDNGKILYVGKAKNIKSRVKSHFTGEAKDLKYQRLNKEVSDITFQLAGSEVIAALLEDHEIRHHWPPYNKAQKRPVPRYGVYEYMDNAGRIRLGINRVRNCFPAVRMFHSLYAARTWLFDVIKEFELSPQLAGLPSMGEFEAEVEVHVQRYRIFKNRLATDNVHRLILKKGRKPDESGFILVSNNQYKGVGFIPQKVDFRSEPSNILKYLQLKKTGHLPDRIVEKELMTAGEYEVLTFTGEELKLPGAD